jgi:tungstate transport system substrate-binding protein
VAGNDILQALQKIQSAQAPFVSRGDKSGTHAAELRLWKAAGIDLEQAKGPWYRDTGSGMGPALNTPASLNAYLLADRGTWLSFRSGSTLTAPSSTPRIRHGSYRAKQYNHHYDGSQGDRPLLNA